MSIPHEPWLVALSIAIAIQGSFVGLSLARGIDSAETVERARDALSALASEVDFPPRKLRVIKEELENRINFFGIEAFLPAAVLNGYDPDEHPRLGVYYAVRDAERGEQTPGVGAEFPYADDPSLWQGLELVR